MMGVAYGGVGAAEMRRKVGWVWHVGCGCGRDVEESGVGVPYGGIGVAEMRRKVGWVWLMGVLMWQR